MKIVKYLYRLLKMIMVIICLVLSLIVFALVDNFLPLIPSFFKVTSSAFIVVLLTYWIFKNKLNLNCFYKRFSLYLLIIFLVLNSLYYFSKALNHFRGENQYAYGVGNAFHSLSILTHNSAANWFISSFYSMFPLSTQLTLRVVDEAAKVFKIKSDFDHSFPRAPSYCHDGRAYDCFRKIFLTINRTSSFTNVGAILMVAVGAKMIFDEKSLEKGNHENDAFKYILPIVEVTILSHRSLINGGFFRDKLIGFPKNEIDKLSPKEIELIKKLDEKYNIDEEISNLLYLGFQKDKLVDGFANRVTEAVLLDMVDREIIKKFYGVSNDKAQIILKKIENDRKRCSANCQGLVRKYHSELKYIEKVYKDLGII